MAAPQQLLSLFHYLRLRLFVAVFRALLGWRTSEHIRRDAALLPLAEAGVRKQRIEIPSRDGGRSIAADLYLPPNSSNDGDGGKDKRKRLPVLVNWHGSGFVFPLHGTDAYFCTRMARDASLAVLDADYRKAPESPHPAAIDDAEDALRWVASVAGSAYNLDAGRVAVSGFSAGGHIAAVAATHLKTRLEAESALGLAIPMLLSVYGSADLATDAAAKRAPSPTLRAHPAWILNMFADAWAPDARARTDPTVSPAFADLDAFPATTAFVTCEGDNLRAEMETLAERLEAAAGAGAGNEKRRVHYKMLEGVCHAFDKGIKEENSGSLPWIRREEAYAWAASLLKDTLHPQQ